MCLDPFLICIFLWLSLFCLRAVVMEESTYAPVLAVMTYAPVFVDCSTDAPFSLWLLLSCGVWLSPILFPYCLPGRYIINTWFLLPLFVIVWYIIGVLRDAKDVSTIDQDGYVPRWALQCLYSLILCTFMQKHIHHWTSIRTQQRLPKPCAYKRKTTAPWTTLGHRSLSRKILWIQIHSSIPRCRPWGNNCDVVHPMTSIVCSPG